ncbi:MAG: hypothetical protein EB068_01785, partial [Betaproteobacteria bacterium]|nr:hypothetical protein [Betaproteobacteria bacterium]
MFELLGITPQALTSQVLIGLINGSFYALLSLGLAVIFGLLNVINFTHGAQYMLGAMFTWIGLTQLGGWLDMPEFQLNYFVALLVAPLLVGLLSIVLEKTMLKRLYHLDHLYGLLLTFGLALILEGLFRHWFGVLGNSYPVPEVLEGGLRVSGLFLPYYRLWVVALALIVCFATWYFIERTKLGSLLRAGTENPRLLQALGVNVPLIITLTYGAGCALAAFAGVMAAPVYQVTAVMGSNLIIVVFAVVVIGGMGSIAGAIVTGLGLGVVEGLTKVFYPQASSVSMWGVTPEIGVLLGFFASIALGYVFGALAIRRQGIYFAMITLALAQVVYFIATQVPFTKGEDGIQGVPRGVFLGIFDLSPSTSMYYFALAVFALAFFFIQRIVHSPFGQVLKSIRENEPRAISLGYNVDRYKLIAFTLSAGLAGLGGALKSLVLQLASLGDVFWHTSGEAVLMTILGGIGTFWGPIAGAAVIVNLQNYLANLGGWSTIATGFIFVVCVLAFRRGIVGEIAHR